MHHRSVISRRRSSSASLMACGFAVCALAGCATAGNGDPDSNPYDAFADLMAARDVDATVALFAADATYRDRTFDFEVSGHDAIREVLRSTIDGFGRPRLETRRVLLEGNQVVVEWILRGTFVTPILGVPPDSAAIELEGMSIGVVENGLIRDHTDYLDRAYSRKTALIVAPSGSAASTIALVLSTMRTWKMPPKKSHASSHASIGGRDRPTEDGPHEAVT
jgi:steroid delta-isomerase-like uncharacterized protein